MLSSAHHQPMARTAAGAIYRRALAWGAVECRMFGCVPPVPNARHYLSDQVTGRLVEQSG
jgi:hypothetical protein